MITGAIVALLYKLAHTNVSLKKKVKKKVKKTKKNKKKNSFHIQRRKYVNIYMSMLMSDYYLLLESDTNGFTYNALDIISFVSIVCGILVITSKNPIVSVLFLIGLFLSISGYLMMLGINFIGLSYLLVYVGAVSILFLFILMLINVRISELVTDNNNSLFLAIMIGIIFNLTLYKLLPSNSAINVYFNSIDTSTTLNKIYENNLLFSIKNDLLFVSSQIWDGALAETSHITSIGNIIYTVYPLWLILTSLILLLAMVGAIVITIKQ